MRDRSKTNYPKGVTLSPAATRDPDQVAREYVEIALDDAYQLREEYGEFVERRKGNRDQLRSLDAQGKLTEEQKRELEELYPAREQSTLSPEDRAKKLRDEADAVLKRAADKAAK